METIIRLISLYLAIVLHEVAHGYAAYELGDPTARDAKRLTLNPLAHIDPFGSILLPMILVLTHSPVLLGWAKPVPYNPSYFRDVRKGTMIVGAVGPLTNLVLASIAGFLFKLHPSDGIIGLFLVQFCVINVVLALFNLIPIPPLDGSRVVIGLLPPHLVRSYLQIERFGILIVFGLLWLGLFDRIILPIAQVILSFLL